MCVVSTKTILDYWLTWVGGGDKPEEEAKETRIDFRAKEVIDRVRLKSFQNKSVAVRFIRFRGVLMKTRQHDSHL